MQISNEPQIKADLEKLNTFVSYARQCPQSVKDLLCETIIGTNGAQYQLLNTPQHLEKLLNAHYFFLERNQKAIGNITFCERIISENYKSFYIRYFAFDRVFQGGNKKGEGKNKFKSYFNALFESSSLNALAPENENPSIFWAYIDPENVRSLNMNEKFNFDTIGQFKTFIFQRFFPKYDLRVEKLEETDLACILKKTDESYARYSFYSNHQINCENYYILRVEGKIVAGIKCFPVAWKIHRLPGKNPKLLKALLKTLPYSRRLIDFNQNKFLATEGLWIDPEYKHFVNSFLEGVLRKSGCYSLYIWEDDKSTLLHSLPIKWGLLQKIKTDNCISIVTKMNNLAVKDRIKIMNSPAYLSGFDMT